MARAKRPTINRLLALLPDVEIRLVNKARVDGQEVAGSCLGQTITLSLDEARKWGGVDSLVAACIHELLHAENHEATEAQVRRWELSFFKSRALREAVLSKLLGEALFGDSE